MIYMKQEILERINSVVAGYVYEFATDWTLIDRPIVEKLRDDDSFLVMMRPSGVDVAVFTGEQATMENAFHSQSALPYHSLFLYYDGEKLQSIERSAAEELCNRFVSRFENRDLSLDGFRKAVERCADESSKYENRDFAVGECGPWKISLLNRQYTTGLGLEICYDSKPVVKAFHVVDPFGHLLLEASRYHNTVSDKTFNEIFDVVHSEFPSLTRDIEERRRFQVSGKDVSR